MPFDPTSHPTERLEFRGSYVRKTFWQSHKVYGLNNKKEVRWHKDRFPLQFHAHEWKERGLISEG